MFDISLLSTLSKQRFWLDKVVYYLGLKLPCAYFVAANVIKNVNNNNKDDIQGFLQQFSKLSPTERKDCNIKAQEYLVEVLSVEEAKVLKFPSHVIQSVFIDDNEQVQGVFSYYITISC